jgi:choline dehydrogenase-like flavoprotein
VSVIKRGELERFESLRLRPADLRLEAFHPMSTARMGADADASVVDPSGAVRGLDGLYVADGSLLPTSVGVNPMMTIIACATHVAGDVGESLSG